jgi:hypothetical protein
MDEDKTKQDVAEKQDKNEAVLKDEEHTTKAVKTERFIKKPQLVINVGKDSKK